MYFTTIWIESQDELLVVEPADCVECGQTQTEPYKFTGSILQSERLQCRQIIIWQADIEALTLHDQPVKSFFAPQTIQRRRELEFTTLAHVMMDVFFQVFE